MAVTTSNRIGGPNKILDLIQEMGRYGQGKRNLVQNE